RANRICGACAGAGIVVGEGMPVGTAAGWGAHEASIQPAIRVKQIRRINSGRPLQKQSLRCSKAAWRWDQDQIDRCPGVPQPHAFDNTGEWPATPWKTILPS